MKHLVTLFATLLLGSGCAGYATYPTYRAGSAWESAPYRAPDSDLTIIHTNRGPIAIYRSGQTYWVNDRTRPAHRHDRKPSTDRPPPAKTDAKRPSGRTGERGVSVMRGGAVVVKPSRKGSAYR